MNIANAIRSAREPSVAVGRLDGLRSFGFTSDELYRLVAPRRTLARRKENLEPLSPLESDRVLRLERFVEHADRVFGSHDKAMLWLRSEIIALDGMRPIELLESEAGANAVYEILVRIDYGIFS